MPVAGASLWSALSLLLLCGCGVVVAGAVSPLCPVRCHCDDDQLRVICDKANLNVVPITFNPELRELVLSNNQIKGSMVSFGVYHSLRYLDMSNNQLDNVGEDIFKQQKFLKVLMLNNNIIAALQNDSFKGLVALQVLHLNANLLEDLPGRTFAHLSKLETLDLSVNRIINIAKDAFAGLNNLKTLLLRDNRLSYVPSTSVFHEIPNLINLDLGLNSIQEISEGALESLDGLEELSLDGCGLRSFKVGSLRSLTSLLTLRIQENDLGEVPTETLSDVPHLEQIILGQNPFPEVPLLAFRNLKYLRTVVIEGAKSLSVVRAGAFADNSNLEKVFLNHNLELRTIESGVFEGLANIREVSLRGNSFRFLDHNLLPWDELELLDVRDNPLVCNCSLLWLWHAIHQKNVSGGLESDGDVTRVLCAEPPSLSGSLLRDLDLEVLNCGADDSKKQILLGVFVGLVVLLVALGMLAFRYRTKVADVLKTKWNGNRKEPQYQKTAGVEDDTNILQVAGNLPLKSTPVTEL